MKQSQLYTAYLIFYIVTKHIYAKIQIISNINSVNHLRTCSISLSLSLSLSLRFVVRSVFGHRVPTIGNTGYCISSKRILQHKYSFEDDSLITVDTKRFVLHSVKYFFRNIYYTILYLYFKIWCNLPMFSRIVSRNYGTV